MVGYCACCKHMRRTRRPGMGTDGLSVAADIRDGVGSVICEARPCDSPDPYEQYNLSEECKRDMEYTIRMHSLKVIAGGSIAVQWDDYEQRYIKVFSIRQYESQWLWEPRSCNYYEYNPDAFEKSGQTGKATPEDEGDPELADFYITYNALEVE